MPTRFAVLTGPTPTMRYLFNHCLTEHAHVLDLLRRADPSVHITVSNSNPGNPIRLLADAHREDPAAPERHPMASDYPDWLLAAARDARADVVVPYRHRVELAEFKDVFARHGIRLLTAGDAKTMRFIEDKPAFLRWAESLGIPASPFLEFTYLDAFDEAARTFGADAALCIKPSSGVGGVGFRRLVDDESAGAAAALLGPDPLVLGRQALRRLLERRALSAPMMLMPYLKGPERSSDIACLDGTLLGVVTRTRAGLHQEIGDDPIAFAMATTLVKELKLSGLLNIQTRCLPDGTQVLLELNSRAAGGIGQTAPSGVNLPGLLHGALCGRWPDAPQRAQGNLRVARREVFLEI